MNFQSHQYSIKMMRNCMLFISVTFLSLQLSAQTGSPSTDLQTSIPNKLDTYLLSAAKAYKFNGTALVAKNGQVLFHKAYGWKDATVQTLNDTSTKFPILSITKSFTA